MPNGINYRTHIWIGKRHFEQVPAIFPNVEPQLACESAHRMIAWECSCADSVKRTEYVKLPMIYRGSIAKSQDFGLHSPFCLTRRNSATAGGGEPRIRRGNIDNVFHKFKVVIAPASNYLDDWLD